MIDLALYRCRVGIFGGGGFRGKGSSAKNQGQRFSVFSPTGCPRPTKFYRFDQSNNTVEENLIHSGKYFTYTKFNMLLYFYIILLFTIISLSIVNSPNFNISPNICPDVMYLNWDLSFITISQIKIAYFYLIFYILIRSICTRKKWPKNLITSSVKSSRFVRILSNLILALISINFILIGIVNLACLTQAHLISKYTTRKFRGYFPFLN